MSIWTRIAAAFTRVQPGEARVYVPYRQAGVVVSEDTALTNAAVWACVRVIADGCATPALNVYRETEASLANYQELLDTPREPRPADAVVLGDGSFAFVHALLHDLLRIPHYHPTLAEIVTYPAESIVEQMGRA